MKPQNPPQPPVISSEDLLHAAGILNAYFNRGQQLWGPYIPSIIDVLQVAAMRGKYGTDRIGAAPVDQFVQDQLRQLPWPTAVDGQDHPEH